MTERHDQVITAVEHYLSSEYSKNYLFLVPFFRKYYNVDLFSYKGFKSIKQDSVYFTLFIAKNNTMGMIAYDENCRDLGLMSTVPIASLLNFLTHYLDEKEVANLETAFTKGSNNIFSERVSQLFGLSFGEVEPIVKSLPKSEFPRMKVIRRIAP